MSLKRGKSGHTERRQPPHQGEVSMSCRTAGIGARRGKAVPSSQQRECGSADTGVSDLQTPELPDSTFLLVQPPSFGNVVTASLGNY